MLKVGLTGGIGSGKTFVANIFAHLGIAVFYADTEAKNLYNTDKQLTHDLKSIFGKDIFKGETLDRKALADIVFTDTSALDKLNALVHPALQKQFSSWLALQKSPYVIQEAAILFESGFDKLMDKAIVVTAPEKLRVERVAKRDGVNAEQVYKRMNNQLDQDKLVSMADFTIIADDETHLLPQVLDIHNQLIKLSENDGLR